MKPWLLAGGAALVALPAIAQDIPDQAGWDAARQSVTLESGLSLGYVEMGPAEDVPVVLLHGYTDNSRSWSLLAPYLEGRHLIALDLRGHGISDAPPCCYGPETLAFDVLQAMDALGLEKADVVGHSLGSITAAILAAGHPERVDDLVLISTSVATTGGASIDWLWENVPALPAEIDPDSQFMLDWYWNPTPVDEDFLTRERTESAAVPKQVWNGVLSGLSITDWSYLAPKIEAPVLVLWGDQDSLFDAATQDAVKAALPEARHETFAGHGHNMFWEVPEEAGAMIAEFIAD